jgi:chromosome segregation ATPase
VNATSEDILAQRRIRSSELALDAARRRLLEADEELSELRVRVADLEETIFRQAVEAEAEPARLRAQVQAEERVRKVVEQALHVERSRRVELEAELSRRPAAGDGVEGQAAVAVLERELAAAGRRVRELEGELEVVRRQAAEFEHSIRARARAAIGEVGEMGARLRRALEAVDRLVTDARVKSARAEPPAVGSPAVEALRLDDALSRLRAAAPETPRVPGEPPGARGHDPEPGPGAGGRRRRFLGH